MFIGNFFYCSRKDEFIRFQQGYKGKNDSTCFTGILKEGRDIHVSKCYTETIFGVVIPLKRWRT